jgi:pimeloyl-ACP methyl ester carboxylesterase
MPERAQNLPVILGDMSGALHVRVWPVERPRGRLVCLHGLGATGAEFGVLAEGLNREGFEVVCPDWIGHGESTYFGNAAAYRWDRYARCLAQIYPHYASRRTHFLGTSWGSLMLLIFLLASQLKPRSAILVDTPLRAKPQVRNHYRVIKALSQISLENAGAAEAALFELRPKLAAVPEHLKDYYREARFRTVEGKVRLSFDPAVVDAMEQDLNVIFDHRKALARIGFDALFLYGEDSPYREPELFTELCRDNPRVRLTDMPGTGHPPSLLLDEHLVPIMSFLKAVM